MCCDTRAVCLNWRCLLGGRPERSATWACRLQLDLVKLLMGERRSITVVGDVSLRGQSGPASLPGTYTTLVSFSALLLVVGLSGKPTRSCLLHNSCCR